MTRALLIIAAAISLQAQQKVSCKYEKGQKFTVTVTLETKGERFLTQNMMEGIGVVKISAKIEHEVAEFRDNCLYLKSKLSEINAAGEVNKKGSNYKYSFKFKDASFSESTITATDKDGKSIETKELAERMKRALTKEWDVRQKKLNGDADEARDQFGLLGPAFPPLLALPGTLPFADREVKAGDKFEDNGMNFTVDSASEVISITGIREPRRESDYYPEVAINFNPEGFIAGLKIRILDKKTKDVLLDYSSTAIKGK